ncbi:MAG: alpha-L-fucosidase [Verrucomicrobiota bacterium]
MNRSLVALALCIAVAGCRSLWAADAVDMQKRAEELKNLRWGMFICWSFSTFSGKEWTPGVKDISTFKATACDTDQWAQTAKEAGMGYILFLTKHHDGFCLWDTKTTDRKVTRAPLGRDVLAQLRKSCDKNGIKLALYFSEGEFNDNKDYHPGGYTPAMKKEQLKELLTQYGSVEFIWFDTAQGDGGMSHKETVAWCKSLQPECFVGFNGGGAGDLRAGEMGKPGPVKDFLVGEFTYPILPDHDGGAQWFYSLPKHDALCRPADQIFRDYLGAVKYGNVFSLDLGPNYEGKLRDIDVQTLRQVGEMIKHRPAPRSVPLSEGKPARASSVWSAPGCAPGMAFDGDEQSRWGAAPEARSGWLEVDLGTEQPIGRAEIIETFYRTQEFALEYKQGDTWKELCHGKAIESGKPIEFTPVRAQVVRLNILKANEVPTIEEFALYPPAK